MSNEELDRLMEILDRAGFSAVRADEPSLLDWIERYPFNMNVALAWVAYGQTPDYKKRVDTVEGGHNA